VRKLVEFVKTIKSKIIPTPDTAQEVEPIATPDVEVNETNQTPDVEQDKPDEPNESNEPSEPAQPPEEPAVTTDTEPPELPPLAAQPPEIVIQPPELVIQPPELVAPRLKRDSEPEPEPTMDAETEQPEQPPIRNEEITKPRHRPPRRLIIIAAAGILLIGLTITLTFLLRGNSDIFQPTTRGMQVYFFNARAGELQPENLPVSPRGFYVLSHMAGLNWVSSALENLDRPPSGNLLSTWPDTATILDYNLDERILVITLHPSYLETPPLQEALFRSALTLTMVTGPYVDDVVLRAGDSTWKESAATIDNVPEISPARLANVQVVLYLIDESGEGLIRTYYTIADANPREQVQVALDRLITGSPFEGAVSLIPTDTRVNVLTDTEIRSIYVNFSGELSRFSGSPFQANLMISSIVNTVFANSVDLRQVFFLIDSAWESSFHGVADFNRGFEYDETVMMGFVPPTEDDDE